MANVENRGRKVFIFTWKIKNFHRFEKISSPIFFAHSIESGFTLELFCTDHQFVESMIGIYLKLVHEYGESHELDFEISCLGLNGSALISRERLKTRLKEGRRRGFWNFMALHDVVTRRRKEFLPQETLTLQCKIWKSDGDMQESVVCSASSRVGMEQSSFVWPIDGFSNLMHGGTAPHSVRKASQGDPPLSMNFQFENVSSKGNHFALQLTHPENVHKLTGDEDRRIKRGFYDLKIYFINVSGEERFDQEITNLESNRISNLEVLITDELMNAENGYIVNDILYLKCQFTFYEGIVSEEIESTVYGSGEASDFLDPPAVVLHHDGMKTSISSLKDIHKLLYETQKFCDVKLLSGSECIPAHKSILSARSLVFQSMFGHSKDIVEVSDVDVEALRQMILFIYTDTVNDMSLEDTYRLYLAAEKYNVFALKKKCSSMLIENLSKSNVCEMLCFADQHEDKDLLLAVRDFISENKEVTGSTAWKIFEKRNAALAEDICSLVSKDQA